MSQQTVSAMAGVRGFSTVTCVVATCVTCRVAYGEDEDGYTVHFDSVDQAADRLAAAGWSVTTEIVRCGRCAGERACAELGHAWSSWRPCRCGCAAGHALLPPHTQPMAYRDCQSCGQSQDRPGDGSTDEETG